MRNRTMPDAFPSFTNFVCHLEGVQDQTCFGRLLLGLSHSISGIAESFLPWCLPLSMILRQFWILKYAPFWYKPILGQSYFVFTLFLFLSWSFIPWFHGNYTNPVGRNVRFDSKNLGVLKTVPESGLICLNVLERESNRTRWRNLPTKWDGGFPASQPFVKIWFLVYGILRSIHLGPEFVM